MVSSQKIQRQPRRSVSAPLMTGPKLGAELVLREGRQLLCLGEQKRMENTDKSMTVPVKEPLSATGAMSETTPWEAPNAPCTLNYQSQSLRGKPVQDLTR